MLTWRLVSSFFIIFYSAWLSVLHSKPPRVMFLLEYSLTTLVSFETPPFSFGQFTCQEVNLTLLLSVSSNMGVTRLTCSANGGEGKRERRTGLSPDVENTTTSTLTHTHRKYNNRQSTENFFLNRVNEVHHVQQQMNC